MLHRRMRRLGFALAVVVILFSSLVFFREVVLTKVIELSLQSSPGIPKDAHVHIGRMQLSRDGFALVKVDVTSEKDPSFSAEIAKCVLSWNTHGLQAHVHGLRVHLPETLEKGAGTSHPVRSLYRLGSFLTVDKGTVIFPSGREHSFSLSKKQATRHLTVFDTKEVLSLELNKRNGFIYCTTRATDFDVQLFNRFLPQEIRIRSGLLIGKGNAVLTKENHLEDLTYTFSVRDVAVASDEVTLHANEISTHKEVDAPQNHLFDGEWQVNRLSVVQNGKIVLSDVTGIIPTRTSDPIHLEGTLFCNGKTEPVLFEGTRSVETDYTESTVTVQSEAVRLQFEAKYDQNLDGSAKIDCIALDSSLFELLPYQRVIPEHYGFCTLAHGTISGGAFVRWQQGECEILEVEQLSLQNFKAHSSFGEVSGKEAHLFFRVSHGVIPSWGVHADSLSIPAYGIDQFSGDFGLHERYVIPSTIEWSLLGAHVKAQVRGVLPDLKISMQTTGGLLPALAHFFPNANLQEQALEPFEKLALHTQLEFRQSTVNVTGTVNAGKDVATFGGAIIHPHVGQTHAVHELIESISFHGKNLSSNLINCICDLAGIDVTVEGRATVAGTLDRDELMVRFDKHTLSIASQLLSLATIEEQSCGELRYSLKDGVFTGTIPLKGYEITIPAADKLGFSNASGVVTLNYPEVHIRDIETSFNTLRCGGHVVLAPNETGAVQLDLKTSFVDGTVDDLEHLLKHFDDFKDTDFGVDGLVKQKKEEGLRLKATLSDAPTLAWAADLTVYDGKIPLKEFGMLHHLSVDVSWDGMSNDVSYENISGSIVSGYGGKPLTIKDGSCQFEGNIPKEFALHVENATHTVASLRGGFTKNNDVYSLYLEDGHSHFFSIPVHDLKLDVDALCALQRISFDGKTELCALTHMLQLIREVGASPAIDELVSPILAYAVTGEVHAKVNYDAKSETSSVEIATETVQVEGVSHPSCIAQIALKKDTIDTCLFKYGDLSLSMHGEKKTDGVVCKDVVIKRGSAFAEIASCALDTNKRNALLHLTKATFDIEAVRPFLDLLPEEYMEYLSGALTVSGTIDVDFLEGLKRPALQGALAITAPRIGKGDFTIATKKPVEFRLGADKKLQIEHGKFQVDSIESKEHRTTLSFESILIDTEKRTTISGFQASIPPEMCRYIAATQSVPYISTNEKEIEVLGVTFPWDNLIDIRGDATIHEGVISARGSLKDGYYWLGGLSTYLHNTHFSIDHEKGNFTTSLSLYDKPLRLTVDSLHGSKMSAKCKLEDMRTKAERHGDSHTSVTFAFAKDQFGKLNLKSVQGGIYGLDINFQQQSHRTTVDVLTMSGKLRAHVPFLATVFPQAVQEAVYALGMGKGYEMSGDISLDWNDLTKSTFNGFIKGKNFELFNSRIQTLLGCVQMNKDEISVTNLRMSDEAGYFTMNDLQLIRKDDSWHLSIPKVTLKDFRPSLLRVIGKERSKMKPLIVKELVFTDIHGDLSEIQTITGKGGLYFENTFKKEYNIFDIPFELIARLGLDIGLLTPIRGRIECVIDDGKIHLTELKNACSEGKRSKFYLSSTRPSYIGLNGDINISIKMRQYVILKVTEPFILSIQGTITKPSYSLR